MSFSDKNYRRFGEIDIYFSKNNKREIEKMKGQVTLVSTVCPDYPNDGQKYLFAGQLGESASLTALQHLRAVPQLIKYWEKQNIEVEWLMLIADLAELVDGQKEFYLRVADSKEDYVKRCRRSAQFIQNKYSGESKLRVMTFSDFYGTHKLDYLSLQEATATVILDHFDDTRFRKRFITFMESRRSLAEKFRGKKLSSSELVIAAAHGMSLYATHGTLLKEIFQSENLVVINHFTTNLRNFRMNEFVPRRSYLQNRKHFPIGIVNGNLY